MSRQFTLSLGEDSEKENTFKLAVWGQKGVGKSTFISRLFKHWIELSRQDSTKNKKFGTGCGDLGIKGRSLTVDRMDIKVKKLGPFLWGVPSCDDHVLVYSLVGDHSFDAVVAARDQILQLKGPSVPIVFVANKTDIADKTERVYRDLNISCEWEHGHVEISAEQDASVMPVLEQIMKRYKEYVSANEKKKRSNLSKFMRSMRKLFSR